MTVRFGDLAREFAAIRRRLRPPFDARLTQRLVMLGAKSPPSRPTSPPGSAPARVGCASGTDAITLALKALDVGPGDEVITVANTCGPTDVGIENAGARVRLVDADPATLMLDAAQLAAAITPRRAPSCPSTSMAGRRHGRGIGMSPRAMACRGRRLRAVPRQ